MTERTAHLKESLEATILDIRRGISSDRKTKVRVDAAPKCWTTLFRFLKTAYSKGLAPDFERDLSGCAYRDSEGYRAILRTAYSHGLEPKHEYVDGIERPRALEDAYRAGLRPRKCHLAVFADSDLLPVFRVAYENGYPPDAYDLEDREWDRGQRVVAYIDAIRHGLKIDAALMYDLDIAGFAYEHGAIVPDRSHVPFILTSPHAAQTLRTAYRRGLAFDFGSQLAPLFESEYCQESSISSALVAAYDHGGRPSFEHFDPLSGPSRARAQLAAYRAGLRATPDHGIETTPMKADLQAAILNQSRCERVMSQALGSDVGPIVFGHLYFD